MSVHVVYKFFREVRGLSTALPVPPKAGPVELPSEAGYFPTKFGV